MLLGMRKSLKYDYYDERCYVNTELTATDLGVPLIQLDFTKLTPSSSMYYPFLNMFAQAYIFIKNSNVLISRIDNIKWKDQNVRNSILAEALWHRAFWYYKLVNNYGDVPLVLEELTGPKLDFATYSRWTVLEKIEKDLEYAADSLPSPEKTVRGAISSAAANQLLAKVYLANMKYDKAIEALNKVFSGPFSLMNERFGIDASKPEYNLIWDLHRPENVNVPNNTETILGLIDRFEAPESGGAKWVGGTKSMRNYNCGWWYSGVLDSQGKPGMIYGGEYKALWGEANPNMVHSNHYKFGIWEYGGESWWNSSDLRRADINWVDVHEINYNNPGSVDYGKPVDYRNYSSPLDSFYYTYSFPFYITYIPCPDPKVNPIGSNGDWYVFRLAETYLLRAEANYWKGNLDAAAKDINMVRRRAGAKEITSTEVTLDMIFDERARELFAEEPRRSEMVRVSYMIAKQNLYGYTLANFSEKSWYYDRVMKFNHCYEIGERVIVLGNSPIMKPHHVLWPVPQSVITANTKSVINQNIGYDGYENNVPPLTTID